MLQSLVNNFAFELQGVKIKTQINSTYLYMLSLGITYNRVKGHICPVCIWRNAPGARTHECPNSSNQVLDLIDNLLHKEQTIIIFGTKNEDLGLTYYLGYKILEGIHTSNRLKKAGIKTQTYFSRLGNSANLECVPI